VTHFDGVCRRRASAARLAGLADAAARPMPSVTPARSATHPADLLRTRETLAEGTGGNPRDAYPVLHQQLETLSVA
jgi:hypothetical protein